jgi:hypothetical protein
VTNDSKRDSFPINEENLRRSAEHLATVGPFMRRRAAEAGKQFAAALRRIPPVERQGVEW